MLNRFCRFSRAMSQIDRCWHKLASKEMAKYGLKSAHALYLTTLLSFAEGITAAKLAEVCCKNKADVSRRITQLERKGLVTKVDSGAKRYRARLLLTEAGKLAAEHVQQRTDVAVDLAGSGMAEEERKVFYRCLELITANLQNLSKKGLPQG